MKPRLANAVPPLGLGQTKPSGYALRLTVLQHPPVLLMAYLLIASRELVFDSQFNNLPVFNSVWQAIILQSLLLAQCSEIGLPSLLILTQRN